MNFNLPVRTRYGPYPPGTRFLFSACYHECEGGSPENVPGIEMKRSPIPNDKTVYITYPNCCPTCRGRPEEAMPVHWACGHAYRGEMDDPNIRKEFFFDRNDFRFSRAGFTIAHPRWCPECIYERSFQIYKDHQFIQQGFMGPNPQQNDKMFHVAWNMGIRQGRIEGLSKDSRPPYDEDEDGPLSEILRSLAGMAIEDVMAKDMSDLSNRMNSTTLAADPNRLPFTFPVPAGETGAAYRFRAGGSDTELNYEESIWHPRSDDHRWKLGVDQLISLWYQQMNTRSEAELQGMKDELKTVFVDARNKGLLFQLCAEKEVLWEPQGEKRTAVLARMTRGFHVVDSLDYGAGDEMQM